MEAEKNNPVKEAVKAYLDKRAAEDVQFAASYAKEHKSLDECWAYIISEARKRQVNGGAYIPDDEVFGMAVHYYDEDGVTMPGYVNGRKEEPKPTATTTKGGYQVCRHFEIGKRTRRGENAETYANEVVQNWISEDGKETIVARPSAMLGYGSFRWLTDEPMSIKDGNRIGFYGYCGDKYTIATTETAIYSLLPTIRRNGYSSPIRGVAQSELFKSLLTDPRIEALLKNGQEALLTNSVLHHVPGERWPQMRIAMRHKYIVKDATMWLDYLRLLEHFGKDIRNPKFVCPDKLHVEHDKLAAKKSAEDKQRRKMAEEDRAKSHEKLYHKLHGRHFGIVFGDEDITISVLGTVEEIRQEGKAMHHCVFACGYFLKPDSLILSARDKDGNRIETIELSLKTYEVLQSRGVCNSITDKHDRILQLVKDNINKIKNPSKWNTKLQSKSA